MRMPQTTAYVVNNGLALGSGGPQLTVHHRPSSQVHSVSIVVQLLRAESSQHGPCTDT